MDSADELGVTVAGVEGHILGAALTVVDGEMLGVGLTVMEGVIVGAGLTAVEGDKQSLHNYYVLNLGIRESSKNK